MSAIPASWCAGYERAVHPCCSTARACPSTVTSSSAASRPIPSKSNTYAIAWRLQTARKAETRARRMAALLGMLSRGEKLH